MIKSPWARIANFPDSDYPVTTITIDEKLFVQTSYLRFVVYDAILDSWSDQGSIPSSAYLSWGFSIKNKIYTGSYNNNWLYEYNLSTDMWVQTDYFPFYALPSIGIGLATSNYGFLFSNENALWKYDPTFDTWQKQSTYPNLYDIQGSAIGDDLYILGYNEKTSKMEIWKYDTILNEWLNLSISPEVSVLEPYNIVSFFSIENRIFLGNANNTTYTYDKQTNVWTKGLNIPGPSLYRYGKILFSSGSKGYIILNEGQLWEFDPNYLQ
jgi:hypothetical protein